MPKVSVIVPVYQVEKYLAKCLQSLCEQTLKDIEILVVNNGASPAERRIINKFSASDDRIIVINHEKNIGLGYARNSALEIAKGDYISFVDSDDWVDKGMMEAFYLEAIRTDADLVLGTFYEVSSNERVIKTIPLDATIWQFKVPFSWRAHPDIFYLPTPVWDKFYKRTIIEENKIRFCKEIGEDIGFKWEFFTRSNRISTLPEPMYYYRVRTSSLTSGKKICVDVFRIHDAARDFLVSHGLYEDLKGEFYVREINEVLYLSWKARNALLADDITFTAYHNLAKKAFGSMRPEDVFPKAPYINFLYMFLFLHITMYNNPAQYRAILRAWENIASRRKRSTVKVGKFHLERSQDLSRLDDPWLSIEHSHSFFEKVQSSMIDKPHYTDDTQTKAAEIGNGYIVMMPPTTEMSGAPVTVSLSFTRPPEVNTLSFIAWTMHPHRSKAIDVVASVDTVESSGNPIAMVKTMAASTPYCLIMLDLAAFEVDEVIELRLQVQGAGPFPLHNAGVRLSHFLFH
jgi:glycosyltransferase involved in cell wall biosynthesis